MNILVCLKQILDPELPARDFQVDGARREAERGSANLVTNIFCENALETALQLREKTGAGKITVLSFGPPSAEDSLRKSLAMKADAAALVVNDGHPHPDPLMVARVLAAAIGKLGSFDLIMVGREAGDWSRRTARSWEGLGTVVGSAMRRRVSCEQPWCFRPCW